MVRKRPPHNMYMQAHRGGRSIFPLYSPPTVIIEKEAGWFREKENFIPLLGI
jgi:hypothetical protein